MCGVPCVKNYTQLYLEETRHLLQQIDSGVVELLARELAGVRNRGGRLFILGVGGSAGHAGHAVNDFRKICGFEAYAPSDNVAELTARINDQGWDTCFSNWLVCSRLRKADGLLIFSVGGGNLEMNVSVNLIRAIELARRVGAKVFGIVGRDGGATAAAADACIVIPPLFSDRITPHTEGLCAVLWHLLVTHPALMTAATRWEALEEWADAAGDESAFETSRGLVALGDRAHRGALGEQPRPIMVSEVPPGPYHPHIRS
jgi:D-sedoheptulose 7-phosphate isomerase